MATARRNIIGSLAVLGVTAAVIAGMTLTQKNADEKAKAQETDGPKAKYVTTMLTERGDWQPMHATIGQVEALRQKQQVAEISADVVSVSVDPGDYVTAGTPILTLDDSDARRELQRLQAQLQELSANQQMQRQQQQLDRELLQIDKQNLAASEASLKRWQSLTQKSLSSATQLDQVKAEVAQRQQAVLQRQLSVNNHAAQRAQMQASLRQLELAIEAQQELLEKYKFTAEFAGQIGNLTVKPGDRISPGQALFTLFDEQQLRFKTVVASTLAQQQGVKLSYQGQVFDKLYTNPLLEADAAGHSVWFDFKGADAAPGNYLYATWISPPIKDSYLVSKRALRDFERIYYLGPAEPASESLYQLIEAKVTLHGSTEHNGEQYWIVTAQNLPEQAELLTSKPKPLYSGLQVTTKLPEPETVLAAEQEAGTAQGEK